MSVTDGEIPDAEGPVLQPEDLGSDPVAAFEAWLAAAREAGETMPEAMALATAGAAGVPDVRMVLLRGVDADGFRFFTNYRSMKALQLEKSDGGAALLFHWHLPRHRQVRIVGVAEKLSASDSAAYFATRSPGSRISAWASPQSQTVPDRADLERRWEEARREQGDDPGLPSFWGGYRVLPVLMEFWQSGADRLHDRIRFMRDRQRNTWMRERLAP